MAATDELPWNKGDMVMADKLSLKWGTLKSWDIQDNPKAIELLEKYIEAGASMSAALQRDTPEQKNLICEIIDAVDCEIYLEWDGKYVSKEVAKDYVLTYRR